VFVKQSPLTDPTSRLVADRWQLIRPIGSGAAASVYLAKDLQTGEEHALKLLSAELSSQFGFRSRFVSEAKAMSRLRHPNIARVYAWGEDQPMERVIEMTMGWNACQCVPPLPGQRHWRMSRPPA